MSQRDGRGDMKPAMDAMSWRIHNLWGAGKMIGGKLPGPDPTNMRPENRHAIAARMLEGQPFGFTREDVERLRKSVAFTRECIMDDEPDIYGNPIDSAPAAANADWEESLADRIEALLPPGDE